MLHAKIFDDAYGNNISERLKGNIDVGKVVSRGEMRDSLKKKKKKKVNVHFSSLLSLLLYVRYEHDDYAVW